VSIQKIEVDFAIPVELTNEEHAAFTSLVGRIARRTTPPGCVHWLSGYGDKTILQCQADQELLGKPVDPSLPRGPVEPTYDSSILCFETSARKRLPGEKP
jgi:hypothetical protein